MKLRLRLALATLAVSTPMAVVLVWWDAQAQQRAAETVLVEFTRPHLERTDWLEACEANPESWSAEGAPDGGRGVAGPARPREPPHASRPPPPGPGEAPRRHSRAATFFAYDARLDAQNPAAPLLPDEFKKAALGHDVTILPAPWKTRTVEVLLRVPGAKGPCAYVLARGTTEPWLGAILPPTRIWLTPVLLVFLAVLLAMGPVIRRIRRLTASVRGSALSQYAHGVSVEGDDEIAELARAFDAAARDVRTELKEKDRRDRALREFLANTTHDVMIPLTVLQGHLAGLRGDTAAGRPISPAILAAAMDEAHYLGALVENLALATKLDSSAPELNRGPVDLNALVTRVMTRHRPVARQLDVSLDVALPATPIMREGDVTMLEQAVGNVVYNAIRHNRPGGHVAVLLESEGGEHFRLRVLDDGPGIPADELSRLAERGFRSNEARTRAPHGQGLGLHISDRVARLHELTLSFQRSEYGGLQVDLEGSAQAPRSGATELA